MRIIIFAGRKYLDQKLKNVGETTVGLYMSGAGHEMLISASISVT
jgi:hypothetical protein